MACAKVCMVMAPLLPSGQGLQHTVGAWGQRSVFPTSCMVRLRSQLMMHHMCRAVMAMCRADWLPQSTILARPETAADCDLAAAGGEPAPPAAPLALDGNALANLEVCCEHRCAQAATRKAGLQKREALCAQYGWHRHSTSTRHIAAEAPVIFCMLRIAVSQLAAGRSWLGTCRCWRA